jgi:acyl carrier protein
MAEVKPITEGSRVSSHSRGEVERLLRSLLVEICGIPPSAVTERASIDDELRIDSVQLAKVQVAVEEALDVSVDFLEVIRLKTFGPIVDYIHHLQTDAPSAFHKTRE